jgi:hypothetical protein
MDREEGYMKTKARWVSIFLLTVSIFTLAALPAAARQVSITAKTILASNEGAYLDPGLGPLMGELQSVFRYSSYRLLSQDRLSLGINQTGSVSLPGGRTLQITPSGITGNRAEMRLSILKKGRQVFNTVVQLRNGASVTVGGPKHKGGFLLFNIFAAF